jgi:hypothetical protein
MNQFLGQKGLSWGADEGGLSVIGIFRRLLRKPDARDALYVALCVEGDADTIAHPSQIGQRHAPRVAAHLPVDGLGYFVQGCEALALVASEGNVETTKGKFDGQPGSGTFGVREAPGPVARDLKCLAHGHAAPDAETGQTCLHAAVLHEDPQQDDCEDDPAGPPRFLDGHEFCSLI